MTVYLAEEDLQGIWRLTAEDVRREAAWIYHITNTLVVGLSERIGGRSINIPRAPRRGGFTLYPFYFAADLAQCLRFARAETELEAKYLRETIDTLAIALGTRAIDLMGLPTTDGRLGQIPIPAMDWSLLDDRPTGAIVLAAEARHLLQQGEPVPGPMAQALTGWTAHRIGKFQHPTSGLVIPKKKRKGVTCFDSHGLDALMQVIEEAFFYHREYSAI